MTALFIYSYEGPVHMFLFLLKTVAIKVLIEIINSGSVSRGSGVQVSPVTPKHPILGIGKVSSDLSLSLIFPLRVEHLYKKVEHYLKKV